MSPDKSVVKRIATQTGLSTEPMSQLLVDTLTTFAQAICSIYVAEERERCVQIVESFAPDEFEIIEAIRKGGE